jgi:hypothetical protein
MLTDLFFPHIPGVRVERLWRDETALHLAVAATRRWARAARSASAAPGAGTPSTSARSPICPVPMPV